MVLPVIINVIVLLPTTMYELPGARLTGVPCTLTAELPGVITVPAITIADDGWTTTGRLPGPVIVCGPMVPPLPLEKVGVGICDGVELLETSGTGVGVGVSGGLFAALIEVVLLVPLLAGVTVEVCVTTSEVTLVRVTGATEIPAEVAVLPAAVAMAVAVVVVVMQVPHRLGHGGGGVVVIKSISEHSGTDAEVVKPLFDVMLNAFCEEGISEVVVVEELVEAVVDEGAGKGTTYGTELSD